MGDEWCKCRHVFFFSSRRRHTRLQGDWSSDVCSSDLGGVSPVTMDYVNPKAPWPQLRFLEMATRHAGSQLVPRLCVYPEYVRDFETEIGRASCRERV